MLSTATRTNTPSAGSGSEFVSADARARGMSLGMYAATVTFRLILVWVFLRHFPRAFLALLCASCLFRAFHDFYVTLRDIFKRRATAHAMEMVARKERRAGVPIAARRVAGMRVGPKRSRPPCHPGPPSLADVRQRRESAATNDDEATDQEELVGLAFCHDDLELSDDDDDDDDRNHDEMEAMDREELVGSEFFHDDLELSDDEETLGDQEELVGLEFCHDDLELSDDEETLGDQEELVGLEFCHDDWELSDFSDDDDDDMTMTTSAEETIKSEETVEDNVPTVDERIKLEESTSTMPAPSAEEKDVPLAAYQTPHLGSVFVNGLRRSRRHICPLGSICEGGRRRSARLMATGL